LLSLHILALTTVSGIVSCSLELVYIALWAMAQATPFQTEAWIEYAFGVVILLVRIFARYRTVGIRAWQGDDYFAIIALIFWTVRGKKYSGRYMRES
jgi:hypothetical protein